MDVAYVVWGGGGAAAVNNVGRFDGKVRLCSPEFLRDWAPDAAVSGWPASWAKCPHAARAPTRIALLCTRGDAQHAARLSTSGWLIAPISHHAAREYLDANGQIDRMRPIVNGVDLEQFAPGPPVAEREAIVWRCRQHRDEAQDGRLPSDGKYPLREALGAKVDGSVPLRQLMWEDVGNSSRLGWDRVHALYQQARLLVLNETVRAGGCNTILEAAACGTPIVARDVPATREMIRDAGAGWLFDDAEALASAAANLYGEAEKLQTCADLLREWVQQYSWERYCERFEAFAGILETRKVSKNDQRRGPQAPA